jgi:alkylhydroperoxidase/carboxymuconolactone decarboxylase family protein YurZ
MIQGKQEKAFHAFQDSALNNDILDRKTTRLIHLAAAMAVGCYP